MDVPPGRRISELGPAVSAKVDAVWIVNGVAEVTVCPFTVTAMNPLAAPVGTTKEKLDAVGFETGAGIIPPPCSLSATWGVAPLVVNPVPVTVTAAPTGTDPGLKPFTLRAALSVTVTD